MSRRQNELVEQRFDTWEGFLTHVSAKPTVCDPHSEYENDRFCRFSQTKSYGEAFGLASSGWKDGASKLRETERQVAGLLPRGADIVGEYAEAGDEVDVGRYLDGEPENMIEYQLSESRKPVVRFVVSVTANSEVSTDAIFNRGAAVAAAIDALESSGVRCEVWASFDTDGAYNYGIRNRAQVKVKGDSEALDIDRLAFAVCHPSMLRRLCFRLKELDGDEMHRRMGGHSYGCAIDPEPEADTIVLGCLLGPAQHVFRTRERAAEEARRMIAEAEKIAGGNNE